MNPHTKTAFTFAFYEAYFVEAPSIYCRPFAKFHELFMLIAVWGSKQEIETYHGSFT